MAMKPGNTEYLGDGVYAEFDGFSVSVDLRGEGRPEKICFEPSVFEAFKAFGDKAFEVEATVPNGWDKVEGDDDGTSEPEPAHGKCRCGQPGVEPHVCPYASEIRGDDTTLCNCCDSCTEECSLDI